MTGARRLKIVQITEAFGGGVFTSLTRLSSGLAKRGHEVHLMYSRRPETPLDIASHVDPSVRLRELGMVRAISPGADIRSTFELHRILRELQPDIIHFHSSKAGVLGRIASRLAGFEARTFYSPRALPFLKENYSHTMRLAFEKTEWLAARFGGTIVACSQSEYEVARTRLNPPRLALVDNAVEVEDIPPRKEVGDGIVRIGTLGRIIYAKNPEVFSSLAKRFSSPMVQFTWIGGGDEAAHRQLQAASVCVTGWLSRSEGLLKLSELDIYLHPSRWEGMPIALIEAQVCGLPAIATDVVGNRDVIRHGETGFISRDAAEMQDQLARLLEDASLRERMGTRAREIAVQRFNMSRLIDEMEALYAGALAASQTPPTTSGLPT